MKPFKDTYVMYQLLEFIDESSIICLCKTSKKLNEICEQYIEMEDDKRFEVIVNNDIYDDSILLQEYCRNNDVIKIRKLIKLNIYFLDCFLDWNLGLYSASYGGHMAIVQLMIEKGADNWNGGLTNACSNGHMAIVKLMIEKGATDQNW